MEMHLRPSPASVLGGPDGPAGNGVPGQAVAAVLAVPVVPMMNPGIVPGARCVTPEVAAEVAASAAQSWS